jgi:hypothetical protein
MHDCCGRHVVPRHVVRFEREMQEIVYRTPGDPEPDVRIKPVIKVSLIQNNALLDSSLGM